MTDATWFSYGEIRYSVPQILFLLEHKSLLESGFWPPEHIESIFYGGGKGRRTKTEATFVKPIIVIAELNYRLKACSLDGQLVIQRYSQGYDEIDLARRHGLEYEQVVENIGISLSYCQGAKRKRTDYNAYEAGRRYDAKRGTR